MPSRAASLSLIFLLLSTVAIAEPVRVKCLEGSAHGYLALRTPEGKLLAAGEVIQTVHGGELTSRLVYRFKDGSIDDGTAVFTQNGNFHLVRDHRIQKGPSFSKPVEVSIEMKSGQVTVRYMEDGNLKTDSSVMELPADLSWSARLEMCQWIRETLDKERHGTRKEVST